LRIEVDQSGKIEQTHRDTALAFSNEISYAVLIPARVKWWARNKNDRGSPFVVGLDARQSSVRLRIGATWLPDLAYMLPHSRPFVKSKRG
jgi:hypothetical protein